MPLAYFADVLPRLTFASYLDCLKQLRITLLLLLTVFWAPMMARILRSAIALPARLIFACFFDLYHSSLH